MKILITAGTGTIGSRVARRLVELGGNVRGLSRNATKRERVPAGAEISTGDLSRPETIRGAMNGVEQLCLITPASEAEGAEGVAAVAAAAEAGVRHVAFLSIHRANEAPHIPHFAAKLAVEAALKKSGIAHTILAANNFYQNDYWYQKAIVDYGIYPQPIGRIGMNRVDAEDIADAITTALTVPRLTCESYPLAGPDSLTGITLANIYGNLLGTNVRYGGDDLESWEQEMRREFPAWLVSEWKQMYSHFQRSGLRATESELALTERILRKEPRRFLAFAQETSGLWTGSSEADGSSLSWEGQVVS